MPGMTCQEGKWFFGNSSLWCKLTYKMRYPGEALNPGFVWGGRNSKFSKTFLIPEKRFVLERCSQQNPRGLTCFQCWPCSICEIQCEAHFPSLRRSVPWCGHGQALLAVAPAAQCSALAPARNKQAKCHAKEKGNILLLI